MGPDSDFIIIPQFCDSDCTALDELDNTPYNSSLGLVVTAPLPKLQPAAGARLNSPPTVCDSSNLEARLAGVFHQRANPLKSFRGRRPPGRKDSR